MGLLLNSAKMWVSLQNTSYHLVIGHRNDAREITLLFRDEDFDHLSGIQHAKDVDFKLRRKEYRGAKLIQTLLNGKLDDSLIEKSENWNSISDRLDALINLIQILDSDFSIFEFQPYKLEFHTTVRAQYCVYSDELNCGVFLFLDQNSDIFYCKSIFKRDHRDYCANQSEWKILKKEKFENGLAVYSFVHASYREHILPNR